MSPWPGSPDMCPLTSVIGPIRAAPSSPLIFFSTLEPLLRRNRANTDIVGIQIGGDHRKSRPAPMTFTLLETHRYQLLI